MTKNIDPLEVGAETQQEVIEFLVQNQRDMRAELATRPLVGKRLTKPERMLEYDELSHDPARLESLLEERAETRRLTKDAPISRVVIDRLLLGERDLGKGEDDDQRE